MSSFRSRTFSATLPLLLGSLLLLSACRGGSSDPQTGTGEDIVVQSGAVLSLEGGSMPESMGNASSSAGPTLMEIMMGAGRSSTDSAMESSEGKLAVSVESERPEAKAGERLRFTIIVSNQTGREVTDVTVENSFPRTKLSVTDPAGGTIAADTLRWTVDKLDPFQNRIFRFQGEVMDGFRPGEVLLNIVTVKSREFASVSATSELALLQTMPRAGASDFTSALDDPSKYLRAPIRK